MAKAAAAPTVDKRRQILDAAIRVEWGLLEFPWLRGGAR